MENASGPSFAVSESQEMIAQMVRDFANREIRPNSMLWDESQEFPVALFQKMGELGLMGVLVPENYGG
ncbi:MAG: acyl-CoA dehydrogenase family protein, partial [Cyclobacteriaceae bacterium]